MAVTLDCLEPGQSASVVELRTTDPGRLDRLSAYGVVPGSTVQVEQLYPVVILRVGETELSVDREVASEIVVSPHQAG